MRQRRQLTLVAAGCALLAALPVGTVFDHWTWAVRTVLVVAAMCGTGVLMRGLRVPGWAPTAAMAGAGLLALTWLFRSGREYLGIIPSPGTFAHFGVLLRTAGAEAARFAAPVSDRESFLFVAALGIAVVALLVDVFAVVHRRPALAGLPMLAVYSVPVAVTTGSTSWVPFVLGTAGFLWLLLIDNADRVRAFGRRFGADGRDVDPWAPSPLTTAGHRLGAIGVGLAILVPLVPFAMPGGLLDRVGGLGGGGGEGRAVNDLALFAGQLNRGETVDLVKVTGTNDPDPFYLLLNTLDGLTERGFTGRPVAAGRPVADGLDRPGWDASVRSTSFRADIEVTDRLADDHLPIYSWPTWIERVDRSWTFDPRGGVVRSAKRTTAKLRYTVDYVRPAITADTLRRAAPLRGIDPALLAAPPNATVKSTVERLVRGRPTQLDKVMAIRDFFVADGFVYDTQVGPDTDIEEFLRTRHGFCVQFAASFGWLLREAGIPSRVAIGFSRGAKRGGVTVMTNRDLHAWTEVYFPGFGWLPFDATPAAAIAGSATTPYLPAPGASAGTDDPGRGGPAPVPSAATASPGPASPAVGTGPAGSGGTTAKTSTMDLLRAAGPWASGGTLLLLLLLSPALARARVRRSRLRLATGSAPDDTAIRSRAHHAWDELIDTMLDYRLPVRAAETPRATVERLVVEGRLGASAQEGVRVLNEVEEHARYARRPLPGRELRAALQVVRADLAGRATRRTRLAAVLLPPSVLHRWRSRRGALPSLAAATAR